MDGRREQRKEGRQEKKIEYFRLSRGYSGEGRGTVMDPRGQEVDSMSLGGDAQSFGRKFSVFYKKSYPLGRCPKAYKTKLDMIIDH